MLCQPPVQVRRGGEVQRVDGQGRSLGEADEIANIRLGKSFWGVDWFST